MSLQITRFDGAACCEAISPEHSVREEASQISQKPISFRFEWQKITNFSIIDELGDDMFLIEFSFRGKLYEVLLEKNGEIGDLHEQWEDPEFLKAQETKEKFRGIVDMLLSDREDLRANDIIQGLAQIEELAVRWLDSKKVSNMRLFLGTMRPNAPVNEFRGEVKKKVKDCLSHLEKLARK